ncbi:hypothetical protein [Streptomyces sp. ST2-7A]|uniref:hypothetical protein n=1 Tax=Streptomyces sp. ST2-7A TaxID=2907214 RepID=UPI001F429B4F|nr:hypothetical protein [Streptomyces sp. ST2-7A]MCE7080796.1 hypothetical protein [Streptomyces sp. ST2-7A]
MPTMLDVSDDVRAEIGDEEADRLLAGETAPGAYDCTSCRTPGDPERDPTSTVLFVGEETAVLAFAHAGCLPSRVVPVSEEQLRGAVQTITGEQPPVSAEELGGTPRQAVLGVTCGQIAVGDDLYPALVIEPTAPIARPGSDGPEDVFLELLGEQGFQRVADPGRMPEELPGWSVLMVDGELHSILQPGLVGAPSAPWWQAHRPLALTDEWRATAKDRHTVLVYAAPVGTIGRQPREDLLRVALEKAAVDGALVAAALPLSGT